MEHQEPTERMTQLEQLDVEFAEAKTEVIAPELQSSVSEEADNNEAATPASSRFAAALHSTLASWLMALAAGVVALFHYARTMQQGVGSSSQAIALQSAVEFGGVLPAPGHELFLILGQLFGRIPLPPLPATITGQIPTATVPSGYQTNFFTVVIAVIAVMLLVRMTHRLTGNVLISALAALLFAASLTFWQQANQTSTYPLSVLLTLASFTSLIAWMQRRLSPYFFASSFLLALGVGLNPATIFLVPAWLWAVFITDSDALFTALNFVLTLFFVLLALAVHLYAPLRSIAFGPAAYCLECPTAYADLPAYLFSNRWLSLQLGNPISAWLPRWAESGAMLSAEFWPLGTIVGGVGLWHLLQKQWRIGSTLLIAIVGVWFYVIMTVSAEWPQQMLTLFALFAPLIGVGLATIWQTVRDGFADWSGLLRRAVRLAISLVLLALPIGLIAATFASNYAAADRSQDMVVHWWSRDLVEAVDTDAWLLAPPADTAGHALLPALQYVAQSEAEDAPLTVIAPSTPMGAHVSWLDAEPQLSDHSVYAFELGDERLQSYVLAPVVRADGETIAYQLVGGRDVNDVITPWVSAERWNEIQSQLILP